MISNLDSSRAASLVAAREKTVHAVRAARTELIRIAAELAAFEDAARTGAAGWGHAGSATHFLMQLRCLRSASPR